MLQNLRNAIFKRPWGLGEIKHTIIIISISFHGWRCIMIPHADFVLTLAIIGMSKLLYICTQIKPTKLTSYFIHKWIAIIAFFTNCSFFFWQPLILVSDVVSEIRKLYASIHTQELVKTNVEMLWLPKQLYRSSYSISFLRFGWRFFYNLKSNTQITYAIISMNFVWNFIMKERAERLCQFD